MRPAFTLNLESFCQIWKPCWISESAKFGSLAGISEAATLCRQWYCWSLTTSSISAWGMQHNVDYHNQSRNQACHHLCIHASDIKLARPHTCLFERTIIDQARQHTLKEGGDDSMNGGRDLASSNVILPGVEPALHKVVCACAQVRNLLESVVSPMTTDGIPTLCIPVSNKPTVKLMKEPSNSASPEHAQLCPANQCFEACSFKASSACMHCRSCQAAQLSHEKTPCRRALAASQRSCSPLYHRRVA